MMCAVGAVSTVCCGFPPASADDLGEPIFRLDAGVGTWLLHYLIAPVLGHGVTALTTDEKCAGEQPRFNYAVVPVGRNSHLVKPIVGYREAQNRFSRFILTVSR